VGVKVKVKVGVADASEVAFSLLGLVEGGRRGKLPPLPGEMVAVGTGGTGGALV
jgi:hypothetical protein